MPWNVFQQQNISYLGFRLMGKGIKPRSDKLQALTRWSTESDNQFGRLTSMWTSPNFHKYAKNVSKGLLPTCFIMSCLSILPFIWKQTTITTIGNGVHARQRSLRMLHLAMTSRTSTSQKLELLSLTYVIQTAKNK